MTEDDRAPRPDPVPGAPSAPATPDPTATSSSTADEWLLIGQIVGAFGVQGEVKVRPETDFPERFRSTPTVYLGPQLKPTQVTGARFAGPHVLLRLAGIDDATSAAKLRGLRLYVPVAQAMPLPADRFYLHDVIGLRAERPDGRPLGTVADVYTGTGQDVFVIRASETGAEVLVPAVREMVKRVDIAAGVIVIDPIPGMFDAGAVTAE